MFLSQQDRLKQRLGLRILVLLARRQDEVQGPTASVADGMYLRGEPTLTPPERFLPRSLCDA